MSNEKLFNKDAERRNSRIIRRVILLVILIMAVSGGIYYLQCVDDTPTAMRGRGGPSSITVGTLTLAPQTVPMRPEYLGQAEASQTVEIRARVNGFLDSRHFEEGGDVKEGQMLFRIDPRSFKADLDLAKAQLASAEAEYTQASKRVARYTKLRRTGSTTQDELDQWLTAQLVAQANITIAKARIVKSQLDLGYTDISSPLDGHIGMALKDVGSYVDNSNNGLLAVVEKTDPIYVRYTVSEQDILQARRMAAKGLTTRPLVDQITLSLTLADGTPYPYKGKVTYTDPQIDPSTSSSVMRGTFPNPDGHLKPGQFVHVQVEGVDRLNTLLVPKSAVIQNPTGAFIYVLDKDDKAELRNITLGTWQKNGWIVEKGLKKGETIIIDHLMQVRPGVKVIKAGMDSDSKKASQAVAPKNEG